MKKVFYEKPTTETLVVRFEGVICGSPYGQDDYAGGDRSQRIIDEEY